MKSYLLCLFALLVVVALADRTKLRKDLTFMVRHSAKVKQIAAQFHVPPKEMAKLNHTRRNKILKPGQQFYIPVWMKLRKTLTNTRDGYSAHYYDIDRDSIEADVLEEFIWLEQIAQDTLRKQQIARALKAIDRQIAACYTLIDSIENIQDTIPYNSKNDMDNRTAIRKMILARDRAASKRNLTLDIDSLIEEKNRLYRERSKINDRLYDYESVLENAAYEAAHPRQKQRKIMLNEWADDPTKLKSATNEKKKP